MHGDRRVASAHAGVSIDDLTDEERIDTLSGVAAYRSRSKRPGFAPRSESD
jgi:hypothetical protein